MIFVHEGTGVLTTCWELRFGYGDYISSFRGTTYQVSFDTDNNRLFIVESFHPIRYPKRYMSKYGQLMEHAPFCERDIRVPENLKTIDQKGDFLIKTGKRACCIISIMKHILFDVVGWDGCCYPMFSVYMISNL